MSLKAFHIVFVTVCVILALGFGGWAIQQWTQRHELASLIAGIGSLLGAAAMVVYGRWFLRKLQGVSYL